LLVLVFVGYDSWSYIIKHQGPWHHARAATFCMKCVLNIGEEFRRLEARIRTVENYIRESGESPLLIDLK
jgi:hypothetical protein